MNLLRRSSSRNTNSAEANFDQDHPDDFRYMSLDELKQLRDLLYKLEWDSHRRWSDANKASAKLRVTSMLLSRERYVRGILRNVILIIDKREPQEPTFGFNPPGYPDGDTE